tara:strand:- start:1008 stop:1316 length:309 start_codon:yes stop_codon:yes gene_type:complete
MEPMDGQVCGLSGDDKDFVTVGRLNRWLSFALRHHLLPLKETIRVTMDNTETITLQIRTRASEAELHRAEMLIWQKITMYMVFGLAVLHIIVPVGLYLLLRQ